LVPGNTRVEPYPESVGIPRRSRGDGCAEDDRDCAALLARAAASGHGRAAYALAACAAEGVGRAADARASRSWLGAAAARGSADAADALAQIAARGDVRGAHLIGCRAHWIDTDARRFDAMEREGAWTVDAALPNDSDDDRSLGGSLDEVRAAREAFHAYVDEIDRDGASEEGAAQRGAIHELFDQVDELLRLGVPASPAAARERARADAADLERRRRLAVGTAELERMLATQADLASQLADVHARLEAGARAPGPAPRPTPDA